MGSRIVIRWCSRDAANAFVAAHHRHHRAVRAHYWAVQAIIDGAVVGVAIVGRPSARLLCDGMTCEVLRLCTLGGARNVGSRLLGSCYRAARGMGFERVVSYTRVDETGDVYRAAGWTRVARVRARGWDKPGRWLPGLFTPTTAVVDRWRWEIGPSAGAEIREGE